MDVEHDLALVIAGRENLYPAGENDEERIPMIALLDDDDTLAEILEAAATNELVMGSEGGRLIRWLVRLVIQRGDRRKLPASTA